MMISTDTLVAVSDAYLAACPSVSETTLSHRIFGDTKKLPALRAGAEITVGRFNSAMRWLAANWPEKAALPTALQPYSPACAGRDKAAPKPDEDAA